MMSCDKIFDLRTFTSINNTRKFFLDTNVLYWYTYPRFSQPGQLRRDMQIYYDFIDGLTAAGNPLETSIYNLTELLNVIEKNEYTIYRDLHSEIPLTIKDFRKIPEERDKVRTIMQTTLNNVKGICTVIDFDFSSDVVSDFVHNFTNHRCDIFDYSILDNCINRNCTNIISDDSDFSTMDKITLFTANENVLNARNA